MADAQESGHSKDHSVVLSKVEAVVIEQLSTADDAINDWRDIIPEDVDELRPRTDLEIEKETKYG